MTCNSLICNNIHSPTNQIFWNSYDTLFTPAFIGPGTELPTYLETFALANNDITFNTLGCSVNPAPGVGNSWIFTLYQNNTPTSLSVTVSDNNTTAFFNGSVSLVQGDTFAVFVNLAGTPSITTQAAITLSYN
jgi:hypothetical protein